MKNNFQRSLLLSFVIFTKWTSLAFRSTGGVIVTGRRWTGRPPFSMKIRHDSLSSSRRQHSLRLYGIASMLSRVRVKVSNRINGNSSVVGLEELQEENERLRESLSRLESENERLHQESTSNRIVLETFEGEAKLRQASEKNAGVFEDVPITLTGEEMLAMEEKAAQWCDDDELVDGECPIEPAISFGEALRDRAYWLVGLLTLQSCSGFILARNEALLANHPVIVYFLTMLVGAGGNAGNQASVRVIRGLALGTLNPNTQNQFLTRELKMAGALSGILSAAGFVRAAVFRTPLPETIAVTASLTLIVFISICLGAILPLGLKRMGVDPAHSSTSIQVIMDILGVFLAVAVSTLLLDSPIGEVIVNRLSLSAIR